MRKESALIRWVRWIVVITAVFLVGFVIGWFARPTSSGVPQDDSSSSRYLRTFLDEMKAESIRDHLRRFTRLPHLAGTRQNLVYAEQIKEEWLGFGLDSVELVPYDVLLSYPNKSQPNYISIVDRLGNEVFNTSLAEPVPAGYEGVADIGELVYVNYGRTEDFFQMERQMGINVTGKIVMVRYGKIFRGNKVKNAMLAGAKGIILFSDPADYSAVGVLPYPDGWNLPGGGAQRGNVLNLNGAGDPLTPGYPAKEDGVGLPKIPVHPIGYHDAMHLLRNMGGTIPPDDWKGALNVSYRMGPGFTDAFKTQRVRMHIHTNSQTATSSWGGTVTPGCLAASTRCPERPWSTKQSGVLGSCSAAVGGLGELSYLPVGTQRSLDCWDQQNGLRTMPSCMYTLRVDCTPSLHTLVYDLTKQILSPEDGEEGMSLYESWHKRDNWTSDRDAPRISKLGSGSDFEAYFIRLGIAAGRARYTKNRKTERYSSYPVYHSVYETFEIVERFYDPAFRRLRAVAQVRGGLIFRLADSQLLPLDADEYAGSLRKYALSIAQRAQKHPEEMNTYGVTFDALFSAVDNFTVAARDFHVRLQELNRADSLQVRIVNDQLMHLIFAPSSHNKYAGESFPGIYDALFDIEHSANQQQAWQEVRRQISIAAFTVHAAAMTLTPPA
ncbi:hypothetical protein NHX12_008264 [Muraenolepis orangiensis]|uniref:N-acetylated alpha-linked acidic dipeptidase 2 n=1 Tax=Muraenolepis orangiensis TaxID=630683 RepID=A0A9Q0DMJ8_9TELE|nr:hypothetical protein NHX12_008264 [Muraenolepis orangiensis]